MKRKARHILKRDWSGLRGEIAGIITNNRFDENRIRLLSVYSDVAEIEKKIYGTFCHNSAQQPVWLWEHLKLESSSLQLDRPEDYLKDLILPDEDIYFFINDTNDKFWFYEGKIDAIVSVIGETTLIDEMYFASKKYDWLICINHHDFLIVTGPLMIAAVNKLIETRPK